MAYIYLRYRAVCTECGKQIAPASITYKKTFYLGNPKTILCGSCDQKRVWTSEDKRKSA